MKDIRSITYADNISTLAFIALVKKRYTSSVLFPAAFYRIAQDIGMSDGRMVKKYLRYAIALDLVSWNGEYATFDKWTDAISKTLSIRSEQAQYFDKPFNGPLTFKEAQYLIEQSVIGLNFNSQKSKILSKFSKDKIHHAQNSVNAEFNTWCANQLLRVAGKAKRANKDHLSYTPSNVLTMNKRKKNTNTKEKKIKHIVTGCYHIGKLIGRSHATANRRIKKLIYENKISVKQIVYYKQCEIDKNAIAIMNEEKKKGSLILSTNTGYKTIYGKRVLWYSLGMFRA